MAGTLARPFRGLVACAFAALACARRAAAGARRRHADRDRASSRPGSSRCSTTSPSGPAFQSRALIVQKQYIAAAASTAQLVATGKADIVRAASSRSCGYEKGLRLQYFFGTDPQYVYVLGVLDDGPIQIPRRIQRQGHRRSHGRQCGGGRRALDARRRRSHEKRLRVRPDRHRGAGVGALDNRKSRAPPARRGAQSRRRRRQREIPDIPPSDSQGRRHVRFAARPPRSSQGRSVAAFFAGARQSRVADARKPAVRRALLSRRRGRSK